MAAILNVAPAGSVESFMSTNIEERGQERSIRLRFVIIIITTEISINFE